MNTPIETVLKELSTKATLEFENITLATMWLTTNKVESVKNDVRIVCENILSEYAELWSKERAELKRTILELRNANIYNQTAGTDDEPDWIGMIAELTKQRDHALKERGELEAKLNIRGPFKAAQPQVYFFCEWAVYKKDAVSSICYTTSKEVADWIASRLNERDTLAAELVKVKESQSIPLNVSTAAYSLIGYCQSVEHLKDRLWDITWGDGLTQYADRLKAALTQTQPVLDYKHDETI